MAKKKLNKKIAIIGSFLLVLICLAGIAYVLNNLNRDPEIFIADAETFLADAEKLAKETLAKGEYTDQDAENIMKLYQKVAKNYAKAAHYEKDPDKKIELFFTLVDTHLSSNEFHPASWASAYKCWSIILNLDPQNTTARRELLDVAYKPALAMSAMGSGGNSGMWKAVKSRAEELIESIQQNGDQPGAYVLLAHGRAMTGIAEAGQTTDTEKMISDAIEELTKVIELEPGNVDCYKILGHAESIRGRIESERGVADAVIESKKLEESHLLNAVEASPDTAKAYVNLYTFYFREAKSKLAGATDKDSYQATLDEISELETKYNTLRDRFSTSADIHAAIIDLFRSEAGKIDIFTDALEEAIDLDRNNIRYYLKCARIYYFKGSSTKDIDSANRAIELCLQAVDLPGAQDITGPMSSLNRQNRLEIYSLLSLCYLDQVLGNPDGENQELISLAEESVRNFEQNFGADTGPVILKWHGLVNIAKGNEAEAIRQLYESYKDMLATNKNDAYLSYVLSRLLKDKPEIGLRLDFLRTAINQGISGQKPESLLDYCEVLQALRGTATALRVVESYEELYGESKRSKILKARIKITSGNYDEAESIIASLEKSNPAAIKVKLDLLNVNFSRLTSEHLSEETPTEQREQLEKDLSLIRTERIDLYKHLTSIDPENSVSPSLICNDLLKRDEINLAKEVMDAYLANHPDDPQWLVNRKVLDEPDHNSVSEERQNAIILEVINGTTDEVDRHIKLGLYYRSKGESEKVTEEFKAAYDLSPDDKRSAGMLFDDALVREDFALAQEIADKATTVNFDDCQGNFFAGKLSIVKGDYEEAKRRLDVSLELKPISPMTYVLKSQVDALLKNYDSAVANISLATKMVPLDSMVARRKIAILQQRNYNLGSNITAEQYSELDNAFIMACSLNPQDWVLQSTYVEYTSNRDPEKAFSIQQKLVKQFPNAQNFFLLGRLALNAGIKEPLESEKQVFLDIAGDSLSKSIEMAPDNINIKKLYSEYLRITGQGDKVANMFNDDKTTMWTFYLNDGQYDKAKELLTELYAAEPKDARIVRGLLQVAEKTRSKEDIVRYSEELLAVENTAQNELLQMQLFLELGLVEEAGVKLASFRDRYPDDSRALLLEAWVSLTNNQLEEALTLINRNLATDPENSISWRLRGQVHGLLGNPEQSVSDFQKSKSINSTPAIQLKLASAYVRAGRTQEAIGELMTAIQDGRTPARARTMLADLYSATEQWSNLETLYANAIIKYPKSEFWHYRSGQLSLKLSKYNQAVNYFATAMKYNEIAGDTGGGKAIFEGYLTSLRLSKKYDELFAESGKHLSDDFAVISYSQMAIAEKLVGNASKSLSSFLKALDEAGDNNVYLTKILQSMYNVIGKDEVSKWCVSRLSEEPNNLPAILTMYQISSIQRDIAASIGYIDRAIELASQKDLAQKENLVKWFEYTGKKAQLLLSVYMATGERPYLLDAIKQYEILLKEVPGNTNVLNNLAYLLADNDEQLDKAKEYAKQIYEKAPDDANKMDTYAYVLCKLKEYDAAEDLSTRVIEMLERRSSPIDWSIYEHLGMAQEGLGKKAEAKISYERSLESAQKNASEKDLNELKDAIERVSQ